MAYFLAIIKYKIKRYLYILNMNRQSVNYDELIASIKKNVYNNKNREITGNKLQDQLTSMVNWTQSTKLDSETTYSDLPTDSKTIIGSISELYSKLQSSGAIEEYDTLPDPPGKPGVIYVVNSNSPTATDKKVEYIWNGEAFEMVGQAADLSGAATDPMSEDDILGILTLENSKTTTTTSNSKKLYNK